jgi:hypothetical protein
MHQIFFWPVQNPSCWHLGNSGGQKSAGSGVSDNTPCQIRSACISRLVYLVKFADGEIGRGKLSRPLIEAPLPFFGKFVWLGTELFGFFVDVSRKGGIKPISIENSARYAAPWLNSHTATIRKASRSLPASRIQNQNRNRTSRMKRRRIIIEQLTLTETSASCHTG